MTSDGCAGGTACLCASAWMPSPEGSRLSPDFSLCSAAGAIPAASFFARLPVNMKLRINADIPNRHSTAPKTATVIPTTGYPCTSSTTAVPAINSAISPNVKTGSTAISKTAFAHKIQRLRRVRPVHAAIRYSRDLCPERTLCLVCRPVRSPCLNVCRAAEASELPDASGFPGLPVRQVLTCGLLLLPDASELPGLPVV